MGYDSGTIRVDETATLEGGVTLFPDALVRDFARVTDSSLSGWSVVGGHAVVESSRLAEGARVLGSARVSYTSVNGGANINGRGDIFDERHHLTIGPIGSEGRTITLHRHYDGPGSTVWGHRVVAGCWNSGRGGTVEEFRERVWSAYGPGGHPPDHISSTDAERYRVEYLAAANLMAARVAEWEAVPLTPEDHRRWEGVA